MMDERCEVMLEQLRASGKMSDIWKIPDITASVQLRVPDDAAPKGRPLNNFLEKEPATKQPTQISPFTQIAAQVYGE